MPISKLWMPSRRNVLKAGLAGRCFALRRPFISNALGEDTVKIGSSDPLTGVYAALAKNEVDGAKLAVEEINAKGASPAARLSCWWKTPTMTPAPACRRPTS